MTIGRTSTFAMLAIAALLTSSCSSSTKSETVTTAAPVVTAVQTAAANPEKSPATTASEAPVPEAPVKDFLAAFAQRSSPDAMREGLAYAVPGSAAHTYLSHQANVSEAALDSGMPFTDDELNPKGDAAFELCNTDPQAKNPCSVFDHFKADQSGKIVDFDVSGKQLQSRLVKGNGDAIKAAGASFTLLSAYSSATANNLSATIRVETGSKMIMLAEATYRSPDGKQRQATAMLTPGEIDPKSNAIVAFGFQGVKPGGKVTIEGCAGNRCSSMFKTTLKVG